MPGTLYLVNSLFLHGLHFRLVHFVVRIEFRSRVIGWVLDEWDVENGNFYLKKISKITCSLHKLHVLKKIADPRLLAPKTLNANNK